MIQLDFTLYSCDERKAYVEEYLKNSDRKFSPSELETIANYILYGKDSETGKSIVDRKEVEIKTKYSSYTKKAPESLEELMESPAFDERDLFTGKNPYKTIKPKIVREENSDVPGIKELWTLIDRYQHIIDVNTGKEKDENVPKLTPIQLYKWKHMVIDLRRQQFYLRDSVKPTICMFGTTAKKTLPNNSPLEIPWDSSDSQFSIAPLGVLIGRDEKFYNPREVIQKDYVCAHTKFTLDFRNSEHIYFLLENYEDLRIQAQDSPESTVGFILDTLDFYIEGADLSEVKKTILERKKKKVKNEEIREELLKKFNVSHSPNYISTIWKQKICKEIADFAQLHYDCYLSRENPYAWKKCAQCGEVKLRDTREFMRKSRSSDGFANKCKKCDKQNRKKS